MGTIQPTSAGASRNRETLSFGRPTGDGTRLPAWTPTALALKSLARPSATDQFEAGKAIRGDGPPGAVADAFKQQFSEKATSPQTFHAFMKEVFQDDYDVQKAESYRTRALAGDFRWLPKIRFVDRDALQGANGAYARESGVVLLARDLKSDPAKAAATYTEEVGHHLDTKLNRTDAAGDEGELFRRLLGNEKLSARQIEDIRSENDKGKITVDGNEMEVEFWKPFKAIKNAASKVASGLKSAAKTVASAVSDSAKSVGRAAVSVARGVGESAIQVFKGVGEGVGGFASNLFKGRVGEAFSSLSRGLDKATFQASNRLMHGLLDGADHFIDGATRLLGPIGKPIRALGHRVVDGVRTVADTTSGIVRDVVRAPLESVGALLGGLGSSVKHLFKGEFGEAAKSFGMSFVNAGTRLVGGAADVLFRGVAGLGSVVGTALGLESPGRALSDAEKQAFEKVYGESVDLDVVRVKRGGLASVGAARTVGNTIYLPNSYFDASGNLNAAGRETLAHEMGHVWQNQNGGGDYMHKALWAQAKAALGSGSRNAAYDWRAEVPRGTSFADLNPEQQAAAIEDASFLLQNGLNIQAGAVVGDGHALTSAEADYLKSVLDLVRRGEGAP